MAAQRPAARPLLRRGQRLENSAHMKAFTQDAVRLHVLGENPYKNADDLVHALNEADPKGKTWARQRLEYHTGKIRGQMLAEQRCPAVRRPAEASLSDADLTEGFGVPQPPKSRRRRRICAAAAQLAQPSQRRARRKKEMRRLWTRRRAT